MEGCKEASLSIPLNGFEDTYYYMARVGTGTELSIPLNGFLERLAREATGAEVSLFQFH